MAIAESSGSSRIERGARVAPRTHAKSKAVVAWAIVGAAFIALFIYIMASWIFSEYFRSMDTGVTPVPTYMTIAARTQEAIGILGIIRIITFYVVRPYRREGRISLDALFILAMGWLWWQDPLYSYVTQSFSYTTETVNMGGWGCKIPGFSSPNGCNIPHPLLWDLSFYIFAMAGATVGVAAILRRIRARRPETSGALLMTGAFIFYVILDFILEFTWVRFGLYQYGGGVDGWTVFNGKFYEFPLYECLAVAVMMTSMTALRFFVNDKGETIVERGASELRMSTKKRTLMRYLAIVGALNVCMLVGWAGFVNVFNVHAGAWPKDTQERSYLVNGICGEGTSYACPGDHVATPRDGKSVHISPNGKAVIPAGIKPSDLRVVPLKTTKD
jgi:hypothetical protein